MLSNAFNSISSWRSYRATPLLRLNKLQKNLKLNNVFYKDESKRFHLKSFKALGGAYACLLYTSPSPRDKTVSRMPSSA